ncbi:MAG: hypothetical protein BWY45_03530 [Euryarchaeota archaeon ADurb.Bin294]|nr:MAG: hypothetical protein BWY45_03530 [Euryarchaeota archaeon ADurb.Bin294]
MGFCCKVDHPLYVKTGKDRPDLNCIGDISPDEYEVGFFFFREVVQVFRVSGICQEIITDYGIFGMFVQVVMDKV